VGITENSLELNYLNIELLYHLALPLLRSYPKITESRCSNTNLYKNIHRNTMVKGWKKSKMPPADKWVNKCATSIQWNIIQPSKMRY
jgi:hypothetical protein